MYECFLNYKHNNAIGRDVSQTSLRVKRVCSFLLKCNFQMGRGEEAEGVDRGEDVGC